jgi:predicted nucleic acid-binding protein
MKKVLIDLNVYIAAEWDKKKEAIEFLGKVRKYNVITPVLILFYILRNWKYRKLVDKIFNVIDKVTTTYVGTAQTNLKSIQLVNLPLRIFVRRISKTVGIPLDDARLIAYAALNEAEFLVTYDKKHLKNKEKEIADFLKKYNLLPLKIILPNEEL